MIVYRMMNRNELNLFLAGDMQNIGRKFLGENYSNNHSYMPSEKYVHLFVRLKDIDFIQFERDFEYLATFDIPVHLLRSYGGRGFYKKLKNGKYVYKNIKEYALKAKDMRHEYFLGYEEINIYEPDFDEYVKLFKGAKELTSEEDYVCAKLEC